MKKCILAVAALSILNVSVYAQELGCDYKYNKLVKRVESFSSEMTQESKNKWITGLKKAHQLCEEGKRAEASIERTA